MVDKKRVLVLAVLSISSVTSFYFTSEVLSLVERKALIILIFTAGLWTTEAVPLVATSLFIPVMQALLGVQSLQLALQPFFDTVVMLLLGGFLLATAVEKHDLDEFFAFQILRRVRRDARVVVFAVMAVSAFLSMWISNTASTALLITMTLKITRDVKDPKGNFSKILVLATAYAATAGGLSTLVGTTTCAMAAGFLNEMVGYEISFLGWSVFGFPVTLLQLLAIWLILFMIFPTDVREIPIEGFETERLNRNQKITLAVFVSSVLLWLTGHLPDPLTNLIGWSGHGLSSSIVAGVIAVSLYFTGIIDSQDTSKANWNTLLLIGGGLSLSSLLSTSGLVNRISQLLLILTGGGASSALTISMIVFFGLGISAIASNTASAGIFLPIAISLAGPVGLSPVVLAVAVGISTSLDFMLPAGTPPNAIAYSTGEVSMREMIGAGILLDITGALITIILALTIWPLFV
ncbi:MAG: SLC13 family permease [Candidatus Bathyarchaeia archaeon]